MQCQAGNIDDISGDSISGSSSSSENISETGDNTSEISGTSEDISDTDGLGATFQIQTVQIQKHSHRFPKKIKQRMKERILGKQ